MLGEQMPSGENIPKKVRLWDNYSDWKTYTITLTHGDPVHFTGRYCRHLESPNWHYYERADKTMLHFRKEHMMCVEGGDVSDIERLQAVQ